MKWVRETQVEEVNIVGTNRVWKRGKKNDSRGREREESRVTGISVNA